MLEVVGGAWKCGPVVIVRKRGVLTRVWMPKGWLSTEPVTPRDIVSVELVTQENVKSMAAKAGWGVAGGLLLGGVGAVAGLLAGGERNRLTVILTHRDGRRALLRGKSDEVHLLLGATMMGGPTQSDLSSGAARTRRTPLHAAVLAVLLIGGVAACLAGVAALDNPLKDALREREAREQRARPVNQSRQQEELRRKLADSRAGDRKVEITDAVILDAIKGSDDLDRHKEAFIRASRLFFGKGGSLNALREMGGWVRSQSHKPRLVYFMPGNHVSHRFYYDVTDNKLFQ